MLFQFDFGPNIEALPYRVRRAGEFRGAVTPSLKEPHVADNLICYHHPVANRAEPNRAESKAPSQWIRYIVVAAIALSLVWWILARLRSLRRTGHGMTLPLIPRSPLKPARRDHQPHYVLTISDFSRNHWNCLACGPERSDQCDRASHQTNTNKDLQRICDSAAIRARIPRVQLAFER